MMMEIANLINESYLRSNCRYGYRKIYHDLYNQGIIVNHKKILRIMQEMNIQGVYPKKKINTSLRNHNHLVFPYLLSGICIERPNQVWTSDITYIKIGEVFYYLVVIIDLFSRYILSYEISHSLQLGFCIDSLQKALQNYSKPDIFNTDQGCQYTSNDFVWLLVKRRIDISMDHKGRCFDNIINERLWRTIKQEAIYFEKPETLSELIVTIDRFIEWYNNDRLHQSLGYKKPRDMYYGFIN